MRWLVVGVFAMSLACGGGGHARAGDVPVAAPMSAPEAPKFGAPPTGGPDSIPTPAPVPPPVATVKAKDCQTPLDACNKACADVEWPCWTGCQYCGACSDGLELSECESICNTCRDGCTGAQSECNSACEKQFYVCRDG
jgi:hypothetical protein